MKKEVDYNIFDWWKKAVFNNYANFNGRARRKEYWSFQLVNFIFLISIFFVLLFFQIIGLRAFVLIPGIFLPVFVFGIIIPAFAVLVRRLHDTNRSGWNFLMGLIPFIGGMILLYFYFSDGTVGRNSYGDDPKRPHDEISEIGVSQE